MSLIFVVGWIIIPLIFFKMDPCSFFFFLFSFFFFLFSFFSFSLFLFFSFSLSQLFPSFLNLLIFLLFFSSFSFRCGLVALQMAAFTLLRTYLEKHIVPSSPSSSSSLSPLTFTQSIFEERFVRE